MRQAPEPAFVLPPGSAAAPAVAHDHRHPGQAAQHPAPDIGHHGEGHEEINGLLLQPPPQPGQGRRPHVLLPAQPDQGEARLPGQGGQIVPRRQQPDLHLKPGGVKPPGQLQRLALGAAEFQVLEEKNQPGRAGCISQQML